MVQPSKWTVCKCGDVWITESDSKSQQASQRISLGVALYDSLAARNASLAILPCSFFNYILRFGVLGFWGTEIIINHSVLREIELRKVREKIAEFF